MKRIVSRANGSFKLLRALKSSARERHARRQTLLDGPHLVRQYLEVVGQPILVAVDVEAIEGDETREILGRLDADKILGFPPALFSQLAPVESATGILALIDIPAPRSANPCREFVVMLDRIQDPGNVGAIIRSAAAAGADMVLTCPQCADPWSPRALRGAMGGTFSVRIDTNVDLVQHADRFEGVVVATAGRGGLPPSDVDLTGPVALLLGSEGVGLGEKLRAKAQVTVTIPLARAIESLNVAAAAAVVMFERVRQLATKAC